VRWYDALTVVIESGASAPVEALAASTLPHKRLGAIVRRRLG